MRQEVTIFVTAGPLTAVRPNPRRDENGVNVPSEVAFRAAYWRREAPPVSLSPVATWLRPELGPGFICNFNEFRGQHRDTLAFLKARERKVWSWKFRVDHAPHPSRQA